jgi:hypothetical protein
MNEVVIVTTWNREELLYLCLEAIRRDDSEITIVLLIDRGALSNEIEEMCHKWELDRIVRPQHSYYGNSWNLLDGCKQVLETYNPDIVHLIEDDTLIHKGYPAWARRELSARNTKDDEKTYAAVCGRIGSPHIPNWYESPCASWNADCLRTALGHLVPEYFTPDRKEMQRVLDEVMFPKSKYRKGGSEQDGAFLRCIEFHGWRTCFPPVPLATHFGFWGYNCPASWERPKGSFEERIQYCRDLLRDKERRNLIFGHGITAKEMAGWDGQT